MKIEKILDALEETKWSLSRFLEEFFKSSTDRSERHQRVPTSMMNGTTKPYFADSGPVRPSSDVQEKGHVASSASEYELHCILKAPRDDGEFVPC